MFQVHKSWEFPLINNMFNNELMAYRFVRIALHTYKFWVERITNEGDLEHVDQILTYSIYDLMSFVDDTKNIRVNLISPAYANESGEISMDVVMEIFRVEGPSQTGFLYRCSNGKSYLDSLEDLKEEHLVSKELIYQANVSKFKEMS